MEEGKKYSKWNYCFAFLAMLAMIVIQTVTGFVVQVGYMVVKLVQSGGVLDQQTLFTQLAEWYFQNVMEIVAVSQVIMIIVFGLWYYFGFVRKKESTEKMKPGLRSLLSMVILAFGMYLALGVLLTVMEFFAPELMANYNEMVELAGVADLTVISTIATLILAPISEELVFRGVVMRLLKKTKSSFLAINIIQAAMFGFVHLNLVQGAYAFILGLVLGLFAEKYGSIKAAMVFHMLFNFFGTYLARFLQTLPETGWMNFGFLAVAAVALFAGIKLMQKEFPKEIKEEAAAE